MPGAFHEPGAQPFWRIYEGIARQALAGRIARKGHPMLGLTEHPLDSGELLVVAINYSPQPLETNLTFAEGWQAAQAWYGAFSGKATTPHLSIPANDAVVLRLAKEQ
jgi:hypothetical protein